MKILCDVCSKKEASVFCTADEAALCDVCDHRVHLANKLASKHERFSLLQPSSSHVPICDICQEKRALLFCQQDRAILCRDCDVPLHTANEHTKKHNRFLLTGIKLSATISDTNTSTNVTVNSGSNNTVPDYKSEIKHNCENPSSTATNYSSNCTVHSVNHQIISGGSASNISDYLIENVPGWHFDDFFVDPAASSAPSYGFCKGGKISDFEASEDMLSFFDVEHEKNFTTYSTQSDSLWVPQAPAAAAASTTSVFGQLTTFHDNNVKALFSKELESVKRNIALGHGTKQQETSVNATKSVSRKCIRRDDAFTVPQITSSSGFKKSRFFW